MTSYPSTIRRVPAYLVFAAAAWLAPAAAVADCTTRAAKPAETAFHSRALSALVAALPPVPAGVQELEARPHDYRKPPAMREVLCDFSKEGAFSVTARRVYVRRHSEAERRHVQTQYDALTAQYHALRKTPASMVERQNVLRQKSNDAWKAARDAEKAADKPGAQARDAEYRALRDEADAIDAQHQASVKPQTDELDKRRGALDLESQKVEVRLGMNLQRLPAAGSEPTRGAFGAASPSQSAGLKVHNVAFAVEGTEGPLRQALAAAIDRARLGALVGKAPPDEVESQAVAAGAAPVSVAGIEGAASNTAAVNGAPTVDPAAAAATTTAATPVGTAPAPSPTPAGGSESAAGDVARKAADAVNKLRGLLGR